MRRSKFLEILGMKSSKRDFLRSLGAGLLNFGFVKGANAAKEDSHWDLIVIGGGTAGLPAAIFSARRGANVLIIEAAGNIGGTLLMANGQMSAAGTRLQKAKGIEDTPQEHYDDVMRISERKADPDLLRLAVFNAAETFDWLTENGFEALPDHPIKGTSHEPYSKPRYYWGAERGMAILDVLERQLQMEIDTGNVSVWTQTEVTDLIQEPDGTVMGVRAQTAEGEPLKFFADQTLIASGGYTANSEMYEILEGAIDYSDYSYPYSMGAGILLGRAAGGYVRGGEHHLPLFGAILTDEDYPSPPIGLARNDPQVRLPWEIYVDANGNRFMQEDILSHAAHEEGLLELENERCWLVFDHAILTEAPPVVLRWDREQVMEAFDGTPMFYKANSILELAEIAGINGEGLLKTVATFNNAQAGGLDPFNRVHMPLPIAEPPYYAIQLQSWSVLGFAGIAVDKELRVIRKDGSPVPNLYAAGEVLGAGALQGRSYCGGMMITPALTFGRLLGQRIFSFKN